MSRIRSARRPNRRRSDGATAARQRALQMLRDNQVTNPVILTGDVLERVSTAGAPVLTRNSFVLEAGKPGLVPA